jgi:hypothetical protein
MKAKAVFALLLTVSTLAWARDWRDMREEAGKGLPPRIQYYNRLKGEPKLVSFFPSLDEPESLNVRLVGKWGRGPAATVTGRDSLVYLGLGSEVAIFNVNTPHNPRIVNEVQCRYVVDRVILKDSLLYAVLQGGIEVFNIANPQSVTRIKYFPLTVVDMCIDDTLAYTISADSFKVYRIVSPDSFLRLGACADSGYYIAADSGFAYLCDRWGLYVVDATDPANPQPATALTSSETWACLAESGYCYYTTAGASPNTFAIADISDPRNPQPLGSINNIAAHDVFKLSYFLYLPGYNIVDVSNPDFPAVVGGTGCYGYGVWTRTWNSYSFISSGSNGMFTVNIADPVHPYADTSVVGAYDSQDVSVDNLRAYVAQYYSGMKIVDVADPTSPSQLGSYDTTGQDPRANAVTARDTFAYLCTRTSPLTDFRVIDVSDPADPRLAATCAAHNGGEAIAQRDSLVYVAEDYWFLVYSIANPRSPRLVGSCGLPTGVGGMWLDDTLAYLTCAPVQVVNVRNPANPVVVASVPINFAWNVCVQDTFLYAADNYGGLEVWSIADLQFPYQIDTVYYGRGYDVLAVDSLLYFGGLDFRVLSLADPGHPVEIGRYSTPYRVRKLFYSAPYVYAACLNAGVCIFETTSTGGVAEGGPPAPRAAQLVVTPNPVRDVATVKLEGWRPGSSGTVSVFDATGRLVKSFAVRSQTARFDLISVSSGVLFLSWAQGKERTRGKLIRE